MCTVCSLDEDLGGAYLGFHMVCYKVALHFNNVDGGRFSPNICKRFQVPLPFAYDQVGSAEGVLKFRGGSV